MLSDEEDTGEMAPDVVAEQNGRTRDSFRSHQRLQHCSAPRSLKEESERLKTFNNWNVSFLDSEKLAKGGFYYTNKDDIVKCAFCDVEIGYWSQGDDPDEEHRRLTRKWCPLVMGRGGEGTAGDGGDEETRRGQAGEGESEAPSQDVCGFHGLEIRPFSAPERPAKMPFAIEANNLWRNFEELGVSRISGPVTPHFVTYNSRLKTFENWPVPEIQSPGNLAEAGFYYTSVDDNVLCFHCGGGLKNWEAGDDPWVEHARWFNRCGFVILRKGREFVNGVLTQGCRQSAAQAGKGGAEGEEEVKQTVEAEKKKNVEGQSVAAPPPAAASARSPSDAEKESQPPKSSESEEKELELCRICYVRKRGIVFLPCGHFFSCTECAPSLSACAVCRKPFEATVRAYLS